MTHDIHMKYLNSHDKRGNYAEVLTSITGILALLYNRMRKKRTLFYFYPGLQREFVLGNSTSFLFQISQ